MVLLCDVVQVEARFSLFGDSVNLDASPVNSLPKTDHRLKNLFGRTRCDSLVTWVMSNLVSIHLETVLLSVQDWCTVCAKYTIGSRIVFDAPDGTPR
jgi:hypothetical protein